MTAIDDSAAGKGGHLCKCKVYVWTFNLFNCHSVQGVERCISCAAYLEPFKRTGKQVHRRFLQSGSLMLCLVVVIDHTYCMIYDPVREDEEDTVCSYSFHRFAQLFLSELLFGFLWIPWDSFISKVSAIITVVNWVLPSIVSSVFLIGQFCYSLNGTKNANSIECWIGLLVRLSSETLPIKENIPRPIKRVTCVRRRQFLIKPIPPHKQ